MSTENTDTNSNHPQSRWFICSPKFRFSDQRKTPQWRTGPCPKNKKKDIRFWISFFLLLRARDGTRTRDPNLGKVVLHQLSHSRIIFPHTLKTTHWKSIHPLQLTITASLIGFQPISWHWLRQCLKPVKSQPTDASIFRLFLSILPPLPNSLLVKPSTY